TALPNSAAYLAGGLLVKTSIKVLLVAVVAAVLAVGTRVAGLWGGKDEPATQPVATTTPAPATPRSQPQSAAAGATRRELPQIHDDDPKGSLRLEGQVIDEHDAPVA